MGQGLELLEDRAVPATFTVSSIDDSGGDTLRWAIGQAASSPGPDVIDFSPALAGQTITLSALADEADWGNTGLVIVNDEVTIDGSAAAGLAISGNDALRIFGVGIGANVTLKDLTLTGGYAKGGNGVSGGGGGAGMGGAIYVYQGELTVLGVTLTGNLAQGGAGGGGQGIEEGGGGGGTSGDGSGSTGGGPNGGVLNTSGGTNAVSGLGGGGGGRGATAAGAGGFGGGGGSGYDYGGTAGGGGGGFGGGGGSEFGGGGFGGGSGGGGAMGFGGGGGAGMGGAVFNNAGTVNITNSTLSGNIARGGSGGGEEASAGQGLGGGVFNYLGSLNILNSTLDNNSGEGGVGSNMVTGADGKGGAVFDYQGALSITNSTLTANVAIGGSAGQYGGGGGTGWGGAVHGHEGNISITNSTLTTNEAAAVPATEYGTAGQGTGGAVSTQGSSVALLNSTIAGNVGEVTGVDLRGLNSAGGTLAAISNTIIWAAQPGGAPVDDFRSDDATATSGVGNLIGVATGFAGTIVSNADPELGPLADNGGPTPTMLPGEESPVLEAGDPGAATGLTTDQRGEARFTGGLIDIGSVQASAPSEFTWDGGDADDSLWSSPDNWVGDVAPTPGASLIFPAGAARLSNVNDFAAGTVFADITIAAAGYTLAGNAIETDGDLFATYGSGTSTISAGLLLVDSVAVDIAAGGALDLAGQITSGDNSQDITKTGAGLLRFNGSVNNQFDDVFANEGIVALAMSNNANVNSSNLFVGDNTTAASVVFEADRQLWAGAEITVNEGSTLDLGEFDASISNLYLQGATVLIDTGGLLQLFISVGTTAAVNDAPSQITGGGSLGQFGGSLTFNVANDGQVPLDLLVEVVVAGSNPIIKTGAGTMVLSGANVYTGLTTVAAGALVAAHANALGDTAAGTTVADGATLALLGGITLAAEPLTLAGEGDTGVGALHSALGDNVVPGAIQLSADARVGAADGASLALAGIIGDGGDSRGLEVAAGATGLVVLGGDNTYGGGTTALGGHLRATHSNAFGAAGAAATAAINAGATLELSGGITTPASKSFELNGAPATGSAKVVNLAGDNAIVGGITYSGEQTIEIADGTHLTLSGVIGNGGAGDDLNFDGNATGRAILSGDNIHGGDTNVLGGYLRAISDNAFGNPAFSLDVTARSGASIELSGGVTIPATKSLTLDGLAATGASKLINVAGDNTIAGTITIVNNNQSIAVADGTTLTLADGIAGSVDLDMNGPGTLLLTGNSSLSGQFNIFGGTAVIGAGGDLTSASLIFVDGTLAGVGAVGGVSVSDIGTLAPGIDGVGTLSTGNLDAGSYFDVALDGSEVGEYGQASVAGTVSLGGLLKIDLISIPRIGDTFTIIDNDGSDAVLGTFEDLAEGATFTIGPATFTISYAGGDGNDVVLTATDVAYVWDGGDADDSLWSSPDNWVGDVVPTPGARLVFPTGAVRLGNVNDFAAGTNFSGLAIAGAGYALSGNAIDLDGDIQATFASGTSAITLNLALTADRVIDVSAGGLLTLSGVVSGAGFGITKTGGGSLQFAGTAVNTYTGTTAVNQGNLVLNRENNDGTIVGPLVVGDNATAGTVVSLTPDQIADSTVVTVNEGSTFRLVAGATDQIHSLILQGGTVDLWAESLLRAPSGLVVLATASNVGSVIHGEGAFSPNNVLAITVADDPEVDVELRISAVYASGGFQKYGEGTLALSGENTFTDLSEVVSGTLRVEGSSALGTTAGFTVVNSGAALVFAGPALGLDEHIKIAGSGIESSGALFVESGTTTLAGEIELLGDTQFGAADGATLALEGAVVESDLPANLTLASGPSGTIHLAAANTYTGGTTATAGVVWATADDAFGAPGTAADVVFEPGATLVLSGGADLPATKSLTLDGVAAPSRSKLMVASGTNSIAGGVFLTLNSTVDVGAGASLDISGDLGRVVGSPMLTKAGAGTLVLSGDLTYPGFLNVSAGTLIVDGDYSAGTGVTVSSGTTLGGSGSVGMPVVMAGGTVSPGSPIGASSIGALSTGSFNTTTGSIVVFEIDGPAAGTGYDQIIATGGVYLYDATLSLDFGYTPPIGGSFMLINNVTPGAVGGTFAGLPQGATITVGPATYTISYVGGDGNDVVLTATDVSYIWDGGDADDSLWTSPDNWVGDVVPTPGARLVFPADAQRKANSLGDADFDVHSIVLQSADYTISGGSLIVGTEILASYASGASRINSPIQFHGGSILISGGTLALGGALEGLEGTDLVIAGPGVVIVDGADANDLGEITIEQGTLLLGKAPGANAVNDEIYAGPGAVVRYLASDQLGPEADINLAEGSLLDFNGFSDAFDNLILVGSTVEIPAGSTFTILGYIWSKEATQASRINGPGTIDLNGSPYVYIYTDDSAAVDVDLVLGAVLANGGVDYTYDASAGTVAITGANTYAGITYIEGSTVRVENAQALGAPGNADDGYVDLYDGSSLVLAVPGLVLDEYIYAAGSGNGSLPAVWAEADATLSGELSLYDDESEQTTSIGAADGATLTIAGVVSEYDTLMTLRVDNAPTGRVVLAGDNTFTGPVDVDRGYLRLSHANALGDPASDQAVDIGDGATLELAGGITLPATKRPWLHGQPVAGAPKLASLSGAVTIQAEVFFLADSVIDAAAGSALVLLGGLNDDGEGLGFTKAGAGDLVLLGSDYTGATTVAAGRLFVDGNIAGSSGTTVAPGGVLGGLGATGPATVDGGGTIAPGREGVGDFTTGNLRLNAGALAVFDLNLDGGEGLVSDLLTVNGTVRLGGDAPALPLLALNVANTPAPGQVFTLINNDGEDAVSGIFAGLPEGAVFLADGLPFRISYTGGDGNDVVVAYAPVQVAPADLPVATVGNAFSQQLTATGGSGTGYTFSATGLPEGLSISPAGLISGTPASPTAEPISVVVTVTDSIGSTTTQTYLLAINPALAISPATLPAPTLGVPYSQQLTPSGGSGEGYTFSATGLPEGLSIDPETGLISGTTTNPAPVTATITLTDSNGATTQRQFNFSPSAAATSASLAASANPITFGQPLTLTATITSPVAGAPTATGTVEFYNGTTLLGSATLGEDGVASLVLPAIQAGSYSITAVYLGNDLLQPSTSAPVDLVVNRAAQAASLASSTAAPVAGTPFTLTATLSPALAGQTVLFLDGETVLGSAATNAQGVATFEVSTLLPGQHTLTARTEGTTNYDPSASNALVLTVARSQSQAGDIQSSQPQAFFGQEVTFTATFSAPSVNGLPMTGDVDFFDEAGNYLGRGQMQPFVNVVSISSFGISANATPALARGFAVLRTNALSVGGHVIRAVYLGDANYAPVVTETAVNVQVDPATTQTTLVVANGPQGTTLTARIIVTSPGNPPIEGNVSFYANDTLLGTVPVANGVAELTISDVPPGTTTFRAVYSGDGSVSSSSETVVAITAGPQVVSLSRLGYHAAPTQLVIGFNLPLDAARAQDVANYRLLDSRGRIVPIASATYDPTTQTVTLRPRGNLNIRQAYTLTVVGAGATGITGANGIPLDGSGLDQPGTNFTTRITWRSLSTSPATPAMTFADGQTYQYTGTFGSYINSILRATKARTARLTGLARFGR